MKRLFLLTAFFALLATAGIHAQGCLYSRMAASQATLSPAAANKAAALAADIEQRTDASTGQATFVRKKICPASGKVSYIPVEYCSKSGKFVNVSPREKQCIKSKASCGAKGARATKVSAVEKAHCTAAQRAACARACTKAKANAEAPASAAQAKLVKQ